MRTQVAIESSIFVRASNDFMLELKTLSRKATLDLATLEIQTTCTSSFHDQICVTFPALVHANLFFFWFLADGLCAVEGTVMSQPFYCTLLLYPAQTKIIAFCCKRRAVEELSRKERAWAKVAAPGCHL